MSQNQQPWIRKGTLVVIAGQSGLDLSQMHFKFKITNSDEQSPNTATIRVYNLSKSTVKQIRGEFTSVVLNAGYENGNFGVIFSGTIKQFRRGRENATDTYLDILAADSDVEYNFTVMNATIKGANSSAIINAVASKMGLPVSNNLSPTGGILPRGKVLWGMGRDIMRRTVRSQGSTWSIQNGKIQVIPLTGYLPNEAVVLNSQSGMIGLPEQTDEGIRIRSLLNPKLVIGGQAQVDNASINQTTSASGSVIPVGQLPYNQRAGLQLLADVSSDGFYRIYVAEHIGDTRGKDWYTDLTCLAIDKTSQTVEAY